MKNIKEKQGRFDKIATNLKISKSQLAVIKGGFVVFTDHDGF